eukprot:Nitzschia sp. Nitz4//scaffold133_size116822//179//1776//NITZ4_003788-RA/size116822-snap-gene-0.0-mRNA-1//1//CDS//3329535339//4045//frame0
MVKLLIQNPNTQWKNLCALVVLSLTAFNLSLLSRSQTDFLTAYRLSFGTDLWTDPVLVDDDFLIDKVREDPIPNPPLADGATTMASCLFIMDDNHRLVEWMAYHYYVLPLRYLIVAVDPRSRTSPTLVLNRWRAMGVHVLEWGEEDIWIGKEIITSFQDGFPLERQVQFYDTCSKQAKVDNRTWVTYHDTDEFIVYSHKGGEDHDEWEKLAEEEHQASKQRNKDRLHPTQLPPTTAEEGGMIRYFQREAAAGHEFFNRTCFSCVRLLYGGLDDHPNYAKNQLDDETNALLSGVVDPDRLDTIRYNQHALRNDRSANGLSKAIMDVSRIDFYAHKFTGVHRPIPELCPNPYLWAHESLLTVNHYIGTWEAYSFRDDSRRGGIRDYEKYQSKLSRIQDRTETVIVPWIGGFVRSVGREKARELLQGTGLPRDYQNTLTTEWGNTTSHWDAVDQALNTTMHGGTSTKNAVVPANQPGSNETTTTTSNHLEAGGV